MIRILVLFAIGVHVFAADPVRIRVAAANLTSGKRQSYDEGHGARILRGLKPDVTLIQEFNTGDNSEAAAKAFVTANFGPEFAYFREKTGPGRIPNGVISRYPIVASGFWDDTSASNREFVYARIDIPGNKDLWAVSVHLLTDDRRRPPEAGALATLVERNVPAAAYLVLGGDLNTDNMRDATFARLRAVVQVPSALPADGAGKTGTNRNRGKPYDHVLADGDLDPLRTTVLIGGSKFPNGLVFDSRVYKPLSEVAPVEQGDSGAVNMQHMAVVRDFLIPVE